ncbi:MAG: HAMP domain-containing sensor histidine kinase, partial [Bacteroidota bacterium]
LNSEQLIELIRSINKAGAYISDLLTNLLQWARSQSGHIKYEPDNINLKKIAKENLEISMVNADKKQIKFNIDIDDDTSVFADYNMTSTIFRNLISNAVKFTPDNGEVNISTIVNCDYVEVAVSDTGIGISDEDMKKVFRIDVHHSTSGTSKEKGTGLGLILCKEFVDKHGGKIWAESHIGKGTTFKFTLPINSLHRKKKPS